MKFLSKARYRSSITLCVLFLSIIMTSTYAKGAKCADKKKKEFKPKEMNEKKTCQEWTEYCGINSDVDKKCARTCGVCCGDSTKKFNINGEKTTCKKEAKKEFDCQNSKLEQNCPALCGKCPCGNSDDKFSNADNKKLNCKKVAKEPDTYCHDSKVKKKCPQICGECAAAPSTFPTSSSPIESPTAAPKTFPSSGMPTFERKEKGKSKKPKVYRYHSW